MNLTHFRLVGTFVLPIRNGVVILPAELVNSKHYLELDDIRRYPIVRQFISAETNYRLELKTLDKQRAFVFIRYADKVSVLYFTK